ncbi:ABC transporter permease [Pseudooceanicola sp. CBS1P-1]|uniref:ABC transporter permease subunit n=1 Tax=Pseudooceanicola albus TaxID=2692189 RepID=A0A6L7G4G5_9RHOB|nr:MULTISPECIES: ABC transporter permease [Pseudooceanicola]MBT9385250.1 ABC transporter permease [Pseudooceanicola endophyticus]MXN18891.1 ABC transporter permease subunit [Pseudooceanicola albus]
MLNRPATDTQITHLQRLWLYVLGLLVVAFLVLPVLIVVPMSFNDSRFMSFPPKAFSLRWYQNFVTSPEWLEAIWVSIRAAVLTMLIATPFGVATAYGLSKSGSRWSGIIMMAVISPLIVPVILVAIGLFYLYARLGMVNSMVGIVLAHVVLATPFVIITVSSALSHVDAGLERAARNLGAGPLRAFVNVTLPQIRTGVMSGALFAFVTSLDEVVISSFISGGENTTLTKKMFSGLRDQVDPTIAAVSSILIVLSIVILLGVTLYDRRRGAGT